MNRYKNIAAIMGIAVLLSGCQSGSKMTVPTEIPNHLTQKLEDQVMIDAQVIIPQGIEGEVELLKAQPKDFDASLIIDKMYPTAIKLYEDEFIYQHENAFINILQNNYYYDDKDKRIYKRFFTYQEGLLYPNVPQLENFAMEEALTQAELYLAQLGLGSNYMLKEYYVLSKTFLEGEYNKVKEEEGWEDEVSNGREVFKDDWEDEKGAYIFNFHQVENHLEVTQQGYSTKDDEYISGPSLTVSSNEEGITYVEIKNALEVQPTGKSKVIAPLETIVDGIKHKISNLIIQEHLVIERFELIYQLQEKKGDYYLVPVWEVGYQEKVQGVGYEGTMYFDIETGKEIVTY